MELKQKGNQSFSKQEYTEAIEFYTQAIAVCPMEHTLFSNRSISYSKLGKFIEALADANRCIELKPNFARGYLRKCVALNGLGRYEEVLEPAQEGYKLRGSDAICEGCIQEWVHATELLFKVKILELPEEIPPLIPSQCQIVSDDYLTILLNLLVARLNFTTTVVPLDLTVAYLFKIFLELDRLLKLFAHSPSPLNEEWINAFFLASKLDPTTSKVHPTAIAAFLKKSEELAAYLHNDVDHTLYPIISPVMFLAAMTVNIRCISLNCVAIDYHVVEVTAGACLVFFEKSLLSLPKYTELHVAMYKELLEGIALSNCSFSVTEITQYKNYISKLEFLIENNPSIGRDFYEKAMVSIGLLKLRLNENPGFDHVSYGSGHGKLISRGNLEEILHYVEAMTKIVEDLLTIPLEDPLPFTAMQDTESLICCISGLVRHGEGSKAVAVFKLCEEAFTRILQRQIFNQSFNLDSGPKAMWCIQTMLLTNVKAFLETDQSLIANTAVKWHCFFSEFRALIMRLGMAERYMKTFNMIQKIHTQTDDDSTVAKLADMHQHEVHQIMRINGMILVTALFKQDYKMIQDSLKEEEVVLEYCSWESTYTYQDDELEDSRSVNEPDDDGFLLFLWKAGVPIVRSIDFKMVISTAQELFKANKKNKDEVKKITKLLCEVLIPADILSEICSMNVKRIYLSLDPTFGILPFDLLPLPCDELLGSKYLLVHLSASREIIRNRTLEGVNEILAIIKAANKRSDDSSDKAAECMSMCTDDQQEPSDVTQTADASYSNQHVVIFADPDYNLENKSANDLNVVTKLSEAISALFLKPAEQSNMAGPLPKTSNEAQEIECVILASENPVPVVSILGEAATMSKALQVKSPFILHFATHGFAKQNIMGVSGTFWDDTKCGLLLAGSNTYSKGGITKLVPEAGTGQLSALAVMGMNLQNTRLVYLSVCVSAQGAVSLGESINSLAHAFRAAGAQTVIATLWTVFDDEARMLAVQFYYELFKCGVTPSQALQRAKERMNESGYHWVYWSSFVCVGQDIPLFPLQTVQ